MEPDTIVLLIHSRNTFGAATAIKDARFAVNTTQLLDRVGDRLLHRYDEIVVVAPEPNSLAAMLQLPEHDHRVQLIRPAVPHPSERMLTSTGATRRRVRAHHQPGGRAVR
jgi:hypothetical protein